VAVATEDAHQTLAMRAGRSNIRAFQGVGTGTQVGNRLTPLVALVQQGNVRPHLAQTLDESCAQRIDTDAFDRDLRAWNR